MEVLLDFDKNIYGEELSVKFLCKIRNGSFKDAGNLSKQIALDINSGLSEEIWRIKGKTVHEMAYKM